ncbi:MAG: endonuclease/exonuclease/phosphatase family protein [Melioribacteraceae bacterium]|nr:endonuclease/exonuclease/phosphatase family protein [Melioribacteraceae bacterium]
MLTLIIFSNILNAQDSLKILSYNIQGMKPGTESEIRLLEIIKKLKVLNPDIIGLQEINETLSDATTNQAKIIADSLSAYFGITYNCFYSFTHLSWDSQYSEFIGIITKYPVINKGYKSLPQGTFPRKVVWNYIDTPIGKVNFFSTHLSYSLETFRNQQVDAIIPYIAEQESNNKGVASILVGDFNSIPTDRPIKKLTSNGTDSFYYDSFFKVHPFGDPGYTVQANSLNSRIDYIFLKNNSQFNIKDSYVTMDETYAPGKYYSDHLGVITIFKATPVDVKESNNIINEFRLEQNYPNPFNPSTTIRYSIPTNSVIPKPQRDEESSAIPLSVRNNNFNVTLKVYDIIGREVAVLVNKYQTSGNYSVKFDASNMTSGLYFYRLQVYPTRWAGNFVTTKKLLLLK